MDATLRPDGMLVLPPDIVQDWRPGPISVHRIGGAVVIGPADDDLYARLAGTATIDEELAIADEAKQWARRS